MPDVDPCYLPCIKIPNHHFVRASRAGGRGGRACVRDGKNWWVCFFVVEWSNSSIFLRSEMLRPYAWCLALLTSSIVTAHTKQRPAPVESAARGKRSRARCKEEECNIATAILSIVSVWFQHTPESTAAEQSRGQPTALCTLHSALCTTQEQPVHTGSIQELRKSKRMTLSPQYHLPACLR